MILAVAGFLFLFAPLYFVSASLLKYGLGYGFLFDPLETFNADPAHFRLFNLVSPLLFLGGIGLALLFNIYPVFRIEIRGDSIQHSIVSMVKERFWNLAVVALGSGLLVLLLGYAFLENFTPR